MTVPQMFGVGRRPVHLNNRPENPFWGKYRGTVVATNDPAMRGRIKALVPYPLGEVECDWAEPCFMPGLFTPPKVGDMVWIEFEGGNTQMPIWTGVSLRNAEAPYQQPYDTLQQDDEEATVTPEDDAIHKTFHDHKEGKYYSPHVRGWFLPSGHYILFDDFRDADDSKSGLLVISDRDGRLIRFSEAGYIDLYVGNNTFLRLDEQGHITLRGPGTLTITVNGDVVVTADGNATVQAASVKLGDINNSKRLMTEDDATSIKSALDALTNHTHTAPSGGGPTSGPISPVPDYTEVLTNDTEAS